SGSACEARPAGRAVPMVSRDGVAPPPPRVCHRRGCLVSTMGHGWRWNGMRITGTRKGPSLRAGCRGMALLIVTVGIGCDASTSPEVTEGLDMDGPEAVTLSDPNLDAAVRQILELGDAPVTEEAIRGLSRLGAPEAGITSLEGLEHAVNLEELFLPDNAVRNLQPLAGLSDLRRLD